jgi:hypothetical protein
VRSEVADTQVAALGFDEVGEAHGDLALVEAGLSARGDGLERGRELRIPEQRPDRRRTSARQVEGLAVVVQAVALLDEVLRQPGRHREAVARKPDRRLEQLSEGFFAESLMRVHPPGHRTGHAHGRSTRIRDLVEAGVPEEARCRERAGTAAGVQGGHLTGLAVVEDRERVSADPVHVRACHRQHAGHRDDRVGRGPAVTEHREPGLGGQWVIGRHGAGHPHDVGPVLRRIPCRRPFGARFERRVLALAGSKEDERKRDQGGPDRTGSELRHSGHDRAPRG